MKKLNKQDEKTPEVSLGRQLVERVGKYGRGNFYYYDVDPNDCGPLAIIYGGRALQENPIIKRRYPYWVISYVLKGEVTFKIHRRTHILYPGMILGHCPGVLHSSTSTPGNIFHGIFVVFAGTDADDLMAKSTLTAAGTVRIENPGKIMFLMQSIFDESMNKAEHSQQICSSLLRTVLLMAGSHKDAQNPSSAKATYLECKKFINENFSEIASISEMAHSCGWNSIYIARLFKRFSNLKPNEYLSRLKLNKAAALLGDTEHGIEDIALETGFSDRYTFSRKFKNFYGLSPNQYRKNMQKTNP